MICELRQVPNYKNAAIFASMEKHDQKIDLRDRIKRAGKNQTELANYLGISSFSASRLARGERKMSFQESQLINDWLGEVEALEKPKHIIPVYGYAHDWEDDEKISMLPNRAIEWIDRPQHTQITGEMFCIRTLGETMEPRLFAGEEVYAIRGLPPARGKDCVIEFKDGSAVIKTYEKQKDGFIFARQYNPDTIVKYAFSEIKQIHLIVYRA